MDLQRKVILYIAVSLDGYIARENGDLDWLFAIKGEGDNGFSEFYQTIDTLIMGRSTYDHLMKMVKDYPHADKKSYIFSRSKKSENSYVEFIHKDVVPFIENLKQQPGENIWLVGGGDLLDTFLKENLVDEFIVTISPVVLGKGIPLFKTGSIDRKLELIEHKQYGQFIQHHYKNLTENKTKKQE